MENDNTQFANISNFDTLDMDNSPYPIRENISKQPKNQGNNSQYLEQSSTALNDFERKLSDLPRVELKDINSSSIEISC